MSYTPPRHFSIVLTGRAATNREVAFMAEAVRVQLRDHVAPAWGLPPPGVSVTTIDSYIPRAEGLPLVIADDDFDDEAAGFHNPLGGIVDLGQSSSPSRTASHEALEMYRNANLDEWSGPDPRGRSHAMELCDAVQRCSYEIQVTLQGETRQVEVSDFVYPAWFQREALGDYVQYDHMRMVAAPFSLAVGGYSIALDGGEVVYLAHREGADFPARKMDSRSRTSRLVNSKRRRT